MASIILKVKPEELKTKCIEYTKPDMHEVMKEFDKYQIPAKRLEA